MCYFFEFREFNTDPGAADAKNNLSETSFHLNKLLMILEYFES